MKVSGFVRFSLMVVIAAVGIALLATSVQTQQRAGTVETDRVQPVNSGANPYRVFRDWAQFDLEARPWGGSNGVAIDPDGRSVWAVDRCSPGTTPGCVDSPGNPVHHFDESGNEIQSFGGGMFVWPHGIHVDRDGNVWVADARAESNKGSVVVKFSPEGRVLMTLGTPGVSGNPPEALTDPTSVLTDPGNGDVYVAESHTNVTDPNLVGRISVFDRDGNFLRVIGKTGTGPGEFRTPHALAFDSQGRLIVADRHNHRIQILTKDGRFIREYADFGARQRAGHRQQRRHLRGRLRVERKGSPRLEEGNPDRQPSRRESDHVHSGTPDEFSGRCDGRRHCDRPRGQYLHGGSTIEQHGGSTSEGRDEVRQERELKRVNHRASPI